MPLRPPACYRAVHRVSTAPVEAIWITDDALFHAYQKFICGCGGAKIKNPVTRRHGSHVPGPMESRRRTGRRRLAMSSATDTFANANGSFPPPPLPLPPKAFTFQTILAALGIRKEEEPMWRWEPPSRRVGRDEGGYELPEWLRDEKTGLGVGDGAVVRDGGEKSIGHAESTVQAVRAGQAVQEVQTENRMQEVQEEQVVQQVRTEHIAQEVQRAEYTVQAVQAEQDIQEVQPEFLAQVVEEEQIVKQIQTERTAQEVQRAESTLEEVEAEFTLQEAQAEQVVHEVQTARTAQEVQRAEYTMQEFHAEHEVQTEVVVQEVEQAEHVVQVLQEEQVVPEVQTENLLREVQEEQVMQQVQTEQAVQEVHEEQVAQELADSKVMPRQNLLREEVNAFKTLLSTTDDIPKLCHSFNRKVKEMLLHGSVSDDVLRSCLRHVTRDLRREISSTTQVSKLSLRFYEAVWEGMTSSCKIATTRILREFIFLLITCVEPDSGFEALAASILRLAHRKQVSGMSHWIRNLVKSWARSWMQGSHTFGTDVIDSSINASALSLADALNHLPREMAMSIVKDVTRTFHQECQGSCLSSINKLAHFRYAWLNAAARVKGVKQTLLIEIWQAIDPHLERHLHRNGYSKQTKDFYLSACCDVILNHWINCKLIEKPKSVVKTLDALMVDKSTDQKFSCLIAALDQNLEVASENSRTLFHILRRLGLNWSVYETLKHLPALGIKLPTFIICGEITAIAPKDPEAAFRIYKIHPKVRVDRVCLTTWLDGQYPDFYLNLIHTKMPAKDLWSLLRIPLYHEIWGNASSPRHTRGLKKLHPNRVTLIRNMAWEFAHAEHLTSRQARRNVTQCLLYLKLHRESIAGKPDLTRAIVKVAISRDMAAGKWVGTSTLRWVLRWVAVAEGVEVQEKLATALTAWRQEWIERRNWERRDRNPLRLGPID